MPLGAAGIVVLAAAAAGAADFLDDVLLFPTGLTNPPTPAATTTLGSMMIAPVNESSPYRVAVTIGLLAVAALVSATVLRALAGRERGGAGQTAFAAGVVLLASIALAPAARAGYLAYSLDLFEWAWLLRRDVPVPVAVPKSREALAW